MAGDPIGEIQ